MQFERRTEASVRTTDRASSDPTMSEQNKAASRVAFEVWSSGDLDRLDTFIVSLRQPFIDPAFYPPSNLQAVCLTTLFRQSRVIGERAPDILSIDIQSTFWEVFDGGFCSG